MQLYFSHCGSLMDCVVVRQTSRHVICDLCSAEQNEINPMLCEEADEDAPAVVTVVTVVTVTVTVVVTVVVLNQGMGFV